MSKYLQTTNKTTFYKLPSFSYLSDAFKRIPSNANIDKGRCGIGGTTMELKDRRNSIIVVPNVSIIENKKKEFKNLYGVHGNITTNEIADYIKSVYSDNDQPCLKIMSTPDSFYKIIESATSLGYNIYTECFLLLDESHSYITEGDYRENMRNVFEHFFNFNEKSLISATPCEFSDPRFSCLENIKVYTPHVNDSINIVFSKSVLNTLKTIIEQTREMKDSNLHLFYNSVTSTGNLLGLTGSKDVSIYCADRDENRNKLSTYSHLIRDVNDANHKPNKINIYTTKYYEGWDLNDENANIVLASDVNLKNTCVGINNKAIQAVGRSRNKVKGLYHVTNTYNIASQRQSDEEIINSCKKDAEERMVGYNLLLKHFEFRDLSIMSDVRQLVENYCYIDDVSKRATLDNFKIDVKINQTTSIAQYTNQQDSVINAWKASNFQTTIGYDDREMDWKTQMILRNKKASLVRTNKNIIERIHQLSNVSFAKVSDNGSNTYNFGVSNELSSLKDRNEDLYEFYKILGIDKIRSLKYNLKKMRLAVNVQKASAFEVSTDIIQSLDEYFKPGFYASKFIKDTLIKIYESFGIYKSITASLILKYYNGEETTQKVNGKSTRGYILTTRKIWCM